MANEEITVGEYGLLKIFGIMLLAVIIGGIIVKWTNEHAQEWRLKNWVKNNPGAPIPVQMQGTLAAPAATTVATAPPATV